MQEPDINDYLLKEDLFELFRAQLKKDFEGSGISAEFTHKIPRAFLELKLFIAAIILPLAGERHSLVQGLLYRVDISEGQLKNYSSRNPGAPFEEMLAELIIKRILQKIILKKTFSK
jgi:hypothetical protein